MKKRSRITACLVAGVLILAVSATAAFGSVGGYSQYKTAVMALALEEKNFSAVGNASVKLGDQEILTYSVDYAQDGQNRYTHSTTVQEGLTDEYYEGSLNGTEIWFNTRDKEYSKHEGATATETLMGFDKNDKTQQRIVSFLEIAADTVVGELKNNFVQVGKENGVTLYEVDIAEAQVPPLVTAGLSLLAGTVAQNNADNYVTYEDYDATIFRYYEKTTGKTLPENFVAVYRGGDWAAADQALIQEFERTVYNEANSFDQQYYDVLHENGGSGVVYVHADGSYEYFSSNAEFLKDHHDDAEDQLEYAISGDLVLKNVKCTFGIDKNGKLTQNHIDVTFNAINPNGGVEELVISGDVTLSDYGTTVVTLPDPGDRTLWDAPGATAEEP